MRIKFQGFKHKKNIVDSISVGCSLCCFVTGHDVIGSGYVWDYLKLLIPNLDGESHPRCRFGLWVSVEWVIFNL